MRIFLTGVLGQLGYNLACIFHLKGHHVEGSYHTPYDHPDFLKNKLYPLDFSSDFKLINQLQKIPENIDVLVHCAASTNVDQCEEEIHNTYMVNSIGPGILTNWAKQRKIPLIYLSTDFVFEGNLDGNHEHTLPSPKGHYSKSKYWGEMACSNYSNSSILRWTPLLHCFKLQHHPVGLVNRILSASQKGSRLTLFNDKTISPVSSLTVASTILQQRQNRILHISSSKSISVHELATVVLNRFGLTNRHYCSKFPINEKYGKIRPQHSGMRSLYLKSQSIEQDLNQCFDFGSSISTVEKQKLGFNLPLE